MTPLSNKTRAIAVGGVVAALAASGTGVALASTGSPSTADTPKATAATHRLSAAKHRADLRFTRAEHRLGLLQNRVDHAKALASDRPMLDQEIGTLTTQLKAAQTAADNATTLKGLHQALKGDRALIPAGRVIVRQIGQLRVADATTAAGARSAPWLAKLGTRVNTLPANSPARAAYADLQARVADATHQAGTVAAADSGLNVQNTAASLKTLKANAPALKAIRADHRKAAADRRQIRTALRAAKRSSAAGKTTG